MNLIFSSNSEKFLLLALQEVYARLRLSYLYTYLLQLKSFHLICTSRSLGLKYASETL